MNMRLGEGTGAVLAYPIIACAIEMINTMKSPEEVYELFFKQELTMDKSDNKNVKDKENLKKL